MNKIVSGYPYFDRKRERELRQELARAFCAQLHADLKRAKNNHRELTPRRKRFIYILAKVKICFRPAYWV